jgi:PilZ domain
MVDYFFRLRYNGNKVLVIGKLLGAKVRDKIGVSAVGNRQYERVKAKSILVSLSNQTQQITGFLRDISEGGLKIQKISAERQVEPGDYQCHFVLPEFGKIDTQVTVIGTGDSQEKFGEMLIRMQFCELEPQSKDKIRLFISQTASM